MAADQGAPDGLVALGECFEDGTLPQSSERAAELYQRAVELGSPEGMFRLARLGRKANRCKEAAELFRRAADEGHALALYKLGKMHERGIGVPRSADEALRCFRMSSDQGCPAGMFKLADMYRKGQRLPRNIREAMKLYRLAADLGCPEALYALTEIQALGEGQIRPNREVAVKQAEASAAEGRFLGLVQYAEFLEKGIVEVNVEKARELKERAADPEFAIDQMRFAKRLANGIGCRASQELAVTYFKIAAKNGCNAALACIGECYDGSKFRSVDLAEAAKWYEQAVDSGDLVALLKYARVLIEAKETETALARLRKAAEGGFSQASAMLGDLYSTGREIPLDRTEAFKWLHLAATQGDVPSMAKLGCCYSRGEGTPRDITEAFRWFKQSADLGDAHGLCEYGLCLLHGLGTPADPSSALAHLTSSATGGYLPAYRELGRLYQHGLGVPVDHAESLKWYTLGASRTDPSSMCGLAQFHRDVSKDLKETASWFKRAADLGHPEGLFGYGELLLTGQGVAACAPEALRHFKLAADKHYAPAYSAVGRLSPQSESPKWYTRAAELGDGSGMLWLAESHEYGRNNVQKDLALAGQWYARAVDAGCDGARYGLGRSLVLGTGVPQNRAAAVPHLEFALRMGERDAAFWLGVALEADDPAGSAKYFRAAAENNNPKAMVKIGRCLAQGKGVLANPAEAAAFFKRAARMGEGEGLFEYGNALRVGAGVKQDYPRAMKYLKKAAAKDCPRAHGLVGFLHQNGLGVPVNFGEAKQWYVIAVGRGDPFAACELGLMYRDGKGVTKDIAMARQLLKGASDLGYERAAHLLTSMR
jgi:TPR repeat protein